MEWLGKLRPNSERAMMKVFGMGRGINEENFKKVIDCLKHESMTWTQIVQKTKLPQRTVTRFLNHLTSWGLARKETINNTEYWVWSEHFSTYETEHDYNLALHHSQYLIDSVLAVISLPDQPQKPTDPKIQEIYIKNEMAQQHLRTGYPHIFAEIQDFQVLRARRNMIGEEIASSYPTLKFGDLIRDVREFQWTKYAVQKKYRKNAETLTRKLPPDKLGQIIHIEDELTSLFLKIDSKLKGISLQVENGEPLHGACQLCPTAKVGGLLPSERTSVLSKCQSSKLKTIS